MWDLLPRKWQLTIIFVAGMLAIKSFEQVSAWQGIVEPSLWRSVSFAVTVVGTVLVIIAELGWRAIWQRFPILSRKLVPDLNGSWKGELASTWKDPATGESLPPINARLTIEQTLFATHIGLRTAESSSSSRHVRLERIAMSGCYRLWYDYANGPKAQVRHRSAPHDGVAILEIDMNSEPDRLDGRYYTERKTTGDMTFRRSAIVATGILEAGPSS